MAKCPVWLREDNGIIKEKISQTAAYEITCPVCGKYQILLQLEIEIGKKENYNDILRAKVSYLTRNKFEEGGYINLIHQYLIL